MPYVDRALSEQLRIQAAAELELRRRKGLARTHRGLYPHQVPPDGDWFVWIMLCGRGAGKTYGGSRYCLEHLREFGAKARIGVGAPTQAAARDVCAEGESGIMSLAPGEFVKYNRSIGEATHYLGGKVKFLGTERPEKWNGPQWTLLWADELALWNEDSWDQALFGVRLGDHPRVIVTTTPKNRPFVRKLSEEENVVITQATTDDNPGLAAVARARLYEKYGGTTLGRQELLAEWIDHVDGALFKQNWIENARTSSLIITPEDMKLIVVAVDPAVQSAKVNDETAIAVCGKDPAGEYYVFRAIGCHDTPKAWAKRVVSAYEQYSANMIVAETNQGGEMVGQTISQVNDKVPYKPIRAYRGKYLRAEPVAALYEQGRVHHVGYFPPLETQMVTFTGDESGMSRVQKEKKVGTHFDRMDAMVYGILYLMGRGKTFTGEGMPIGLRRANPYLGL